jgi:ABC-type branched-subunit amino acid transport system substrate-binding protein
MEEHSMVNRFAPIARLMAMVLTLALVGAACSTAASPTPAPSAAPGQSAAPATAAPAESTAPAETGDIKIGHLSYYTGDFADVGPWFDGITQFTVDLINQDPPRGRKFTVSNLDIGTLGEGAVARKFVENEKVDVLLNVANGYLAYRDWLMGWIKANNSPVLPTVHGGAIPPEYGGTLAEPIMRAAPQDTGQASAAVLQASNMGAKKIVVVATENSGSQLQKVAAEKAAKKLGMEVLLVLDIASTAGSYRAEINRIAGVNPDAVIIASQAQDGGTFVKQAAEAGQSWNIIGTTEWLGEAFPASATMAAIGQHKAVLVSGFSYAPGPAWDYYQPLYAAYAPGVEGLKNLPAENSYNIQFYDILTLNALAIEKGGSTKVDKWLPAMREVAMGPGTKCYSYIECVKLIRAGTAVDYSGVTGEMDYTDTGVVSGIYGVSKWNSLTNIEQVLTLDGAAVFELEKP